MAALATIASPLTAFPPARIGVVLTAAPTCPLPYPFLRGPSSARRGNAFIGTPDQCIAKIKSYKLCKGQLCCGRLSACSHWQAPTRGAWSPHPRSVPLCHPL